MTTTFAHKRIQWTKIDDSYYTLDLWSVTVHVMDKVTARKMEN